MPLLYIKTDTKPSDISVAKFGGSRTLSADDPSGDAGFYVIVCKGYHKITVSLHVHTMSGFGGLGIACWPLVPEFAGSNPAEAVEFLGRKNPQHAFLWRGSTAVGPMS